MLPIIVSYHTPDIYYTKAAETLKRSLDNFGLEYDIEERPSRGNWWLNACQKNLVITDMLQKHKDRDLLWIDADSEVLQYPTEALEMDADIATLWIEGEGVFDTTMFLKNIPPVVELTNELNRENDLNPYHCTASQYNLHRLLIKSDLIWKRLPMSYGAYPECEIDNPIIKTKLLSRDVGRKLYPKEAIVNDIEGFMDLVELEWLYSQASKYESIVEIGVWKGKTTNTLLSACKGQVFAIDSWRSDCFINNKNAADAYLDFIKMFSGKENLITIHMDSVKAVKYFAPLSIDMTFIDGCHDYESVKEDILAWMPKTKKLICGHDYGGRFKGWEKECAGVESAVNEIFGMNHEVVGTIWYVNLSNA